MKNKKFEIPKVGMRTIKTGIAVMVCLLVHEIIGFSSPFYACIAAVICMSEDAKSSLKLGVARIVGTSVGGAVGIALLFVENLIPASGLKTAFVPIGVVLAIYICALVKQPNACAISGVVLCAVMVGESAAGNEYIYAMSRIIETAMGIFAAFMVNYLIAPNQKETGDTPKEGNESKD